jgi:hypothetical protein
MAERYPSLEFSTGERNGEVVGIWEGWLQPIRSKSGLKEMLCDLDSDRPVMIQDAAIAHVPTCSGPHNWQGHSKMPKRPDRGFLVRIEYAGGREHPKAYLVEPEITLKTRRHILGANRICAYPPWEGAWQAARDSVADFTDHTLVWLFKWITWVETGHWPGSEMRHDPIFLFATIKPEMQCWCGSGLSYGQCCQQRDKSRAAAEIRAMLEKHSPLFQRSRIDIRTLTHVRNMLAPRKSK